MFSRGRLKLLLDYINPYHMSQVFSENAAPSWILQRILNFFNKAESAEEIRSTVKDDPHFSTGSGEEGADLSIGLTVAQRILDHKATLPGRRFNSITQLNGVQGLGEDKFRDLIYTFNQTAADAFVKSMYNGVIFESNFKLEHRHIHFFDQAGFDAVVGCDSSFKHHVGEILESWVEERGENRKFALAAKNYVKSLYMEQTDSADAASYYFAYWFYRFDADNWFSFDRVRQETAKYLEYNSRTEDRLELRFFKGFEPGGIISDGICPSDLPVVVNHGEMKITVWTGNLYD